MIIARSAGRLGNQLFVIAALRKLSSSGKSLILVGFEDLAENFPDLVSKSRHIPLPRKYWARWNHLESILRVLGALRVISVITSQTAGHRLVKRWGLLPFALFQGGWCQDERLIESTLRHALFVDIDISAVRAEIASALSLSTIEEHPVFFVHIRRGDYLTWPTLEHPAALPESWYHDAVSEVQQSHPNAHFLVVSDDPEYAQDFATQLDSAIAVTADPRQTLAYMSVCSGGILSASSFSWWGAWLASQDSPGPFIAPLHWITWGEGRWDDSHSLDKSSFVTWMPVSAPSTEK